MTVIPAAEDAVLIVDGVFAIRSELNRFWELRIWLEVTPEVSVRRGGVRDQDEAVHRDRYLPAERLYMSEVDPVRQADVVIDNIDFPEPRMLLVTDVRRPGG